jgi:transposase-like protein
MDNETPTPAATKPRRRYTRTFKLQILAEARQPGESLAAVAIRHGLNPNMVHNWRKSLEQATTQNEFLRLPSPVSMIALMEPPMIGLMAPLFNAD